jgi:large subunit ribosomal protein L24
MPARIKKGDKVAIISGDLKGTTATVEAVLVKKGSALLEGIGVSTRKVKPTRLNPMGSTKNVHTPVALSKLAPVADAKAKPVKNTKKTKETK